MEKKVRLNKIIHLLEQGQVAFAPRIVANGNYEEIMAIAESAYDFVILEMEHQGFDFPTLRHSLQYLLNRRRILEGGILQPAVTPLVRIPPNAREMNQWVIKQALDTGVYGLVVPHVATVEQAQAAVAAMRYPRPETAGGDDVPGARGWWPTQAARYWGLAVEEYYRVADLWPLAPDGELFLLAIVEDREGVENLPQILKEVRGVSAVWAGSGDLSVDMGYGGNTRHPQVEAAVQRILAACLEYNVPCCIIADASEVEERVRQGFRLVSAPVGRSLEALERGRRAAGRSA